MATKQKTKVAPKSHPKVSSKASPKPKTQISSSFIQPAEAKIVGILVALLLLGSFINLFILQLLILPAWLLFRPNRRQLLTALPLVVGANLIITALNASLLDVLHLPVTGVWLVGLAFVEALIFLFAGRKRGRLIPLPDLDWRWLAGIYALAGVVTLGRVGSIIHAVGPILHDPISHAYWIKRIAEEHTIAYYYSPGLHIWGALYHTATGADYARSANVVTNLFSSLSVLLWGVGIGVIARNARKGFWTAAAIGLSPLPMVLFFSAGKNASISAFALMPMVLVAAECVVRSRSKASIILASAALLGIGVFHYPMFLFSAGAFGLYVLIAGLDKPLNWKNIWRTIGYVLVPLVISTVLLFGSMALLLKDQPALPVVYRDSAAKMQAAFKANPLIHPVTIPKSEIKPTTAVDVKQPVAETEAVAKEFLGLMQNLAKEYALLCIGFAMAGLTLAYFQAVKNRNKESLAIVVSVVSIIIVSVLIRILGVRKLNIIAATGMLVLLPVAMASVFTIFDEAPKKTRIAVAVLLALGVGVSSFHTYRIYQHKATASAMVDANDVAAYNWINANLPKNSGFVGTSQSDPNRHSIIFPTDGSAWLPVYTSGRPATAFQEVRFNTPENNINYIYYLKLTTHVPAEVNQALVYFDQHGYDYLYVDGRLPSKVLGAKLLVDAGKAKVVYQNPGVSILQLKP